MRILGIDPGSIVTGYGIVEEGPRGLALVVAGAVRAHPGDPLPRRLAALFAALSDLIARYRPDCCAVEEAFYGENVRALLTMGQARGVALLAGALAGIPVSEYSPREVKMSVVGSGRGSKEQVQGMIAAILGLQEGPRPLDATDALAVAVCHHHRKAALPERRERGPESPGGIVRHPRRVGASDR